MAGKRSKRAQTVRSSRARESVDATPSLAYRGPIRRPNYRREAKTKAEQMSAFLATLRETGNVRASCEAAGIARSVAYGWRGENESFKELWVAAIEEAIDLLEEEAWRRGYDGVDKPIVYKGKVTTTYKEYSDRMLEILLKAHRKKFREKVELTGEDGGPINVVKRIERVIVKPGSTTKGAK